MVRQDPPRLFAGPALGIPELSEKFRDSHRREIGSLRRLASFRGNAPDPAARVVAVGMSQGDLVVVDDGIEPIGDIDRPVRTLTDIHGTKALVSSVKQLHRRRGLEAGPFLHQRDRETSRAK